MSFNFIPLGVPISSSFAISASVATNVNTLPETASLAGYSLGNPGPTGSHFVSVTGSLTFL